MSAFVGCALIVTACGDDGTAGCTEVREPEDPLSIQHVIDPDAVEYDQPQPTSGPHLSGPAPTGVLAEPLPPAAQVNVLESGAILVQYGPDLDVADVLPVVDAATAEIVIAPSDSLSAPVMATAWTWKLTCAAVEVESIAAFADRRTGDAPGDD